jgi:uncharacterized protein YhaN
MITVDHQGGGMDYVQFFTKQLPLDLARLAELRDELEKRQGAMSAVESALKDRDAAAQDRAAADELTRETQDLAAENKRVASRISSEQDIAFQRDQVERAAVGVAADRAALDERIRVFQEKVARLTA